MQKNYGKWVYDRASETLNYPVNDEYIYDISLSGITSSAAMLDWIMQINAKVWGRGQCVADLIAAFDAIFRPQANLCTLGKDKSFNAAAYLRNRRV